MFDSKRKLTRNYHTHVKLCGHASGMCEDYVKAAINYGYTSLGMSDHGPILPSMMSKQDFIRNWLDRQMNIDTFNNIYLKDFNRVKEKYKNKINFYSGLEIEYMPQFHSYFQTLRDKLDYLNLAIHFFIYKDKIINGFDEVNFTNVVGYALHAKKAMESGLFAIIVHPDVFMNNYKNKNGFNIFDEECEKASKIIIEAAIKNNVYLEVNCGGLYKVTAANETVGKFGYPREEFWKIVSKYKEAKVLIGVDAHFPKQLNSVEILQAEKFCSDLNLNVLDRCEHIEK